jgi:hypothetical protein
MIKMPKKIPSLKKRDQEWLDARGIKIFKDQMIIPSHCQNLGAELIDIEKCDDIWITGSGKWVCKCRIQDHKPVECSEKPCVKNAYPGIDEQ